MNWYEYLFDNLRHQIHQMRRMAPEDFALSNPLPDEEPEKVTFTNAVESRCGCLTLYCDQDDDIQLDLWCVLDPAKSWHWSCSECVEGSLELSSLSRAQRLATDHFNSPVHRT